MTEYIDRKKIKKSYYFQTKGGVFPKSELFVKRDDIFDIPTADVIEREKIDKAIAEITKLRDSIDNIITEDIMLVNECYGQYVNCFDECLEIIKRNIGD